MAEPIKSAAVLGLFALGATSLLVLTWNLTVDRITEEERRARLEALYEIVPRDTHTNDMLEDTLRVTDPSALGVAGPVTVYRARREGDPHAVVMQVVAPDGYSGRIRLLVGIRYDGTLAGVRVVDHQETPGLGDKIEVDRTDWIFQFDGRSLGDPPETRWTVRKDGGEFDALTGATVTPRAVIGAVKRALLYFEHHKEELFDGGIETADTRTNPP